MNTTQTLLNYLNANNCPYTLLEHLPCSTSEESFKARASAGANVIGAKALIIKLEKSKSFAVLVMPSTMKLDNVRSRKSIGKFRFATSQEVADVTNGLTIGAVPPFGRPVLQGIQHIYIDNALCNYTDIGFNAAVHTRSIVMKTADYLRLPQEYQALYLAE